MHAAAGSARALRSSGKPGRADLAESLARQRVSIEIPGDILEVERTDMGLAREWRDATRWAFREAVKRIRCGRILPLHSRTAGPGAYLLQRGGGKRTCSRSVRKCIEVANPRCRIYSIPNPTRERAPPNPRTIHAEPTATQVHIDSTLDEQRSFEPSAEFSQKAQIKSLAEYESAYREIQ